MNRPERHFRARLAVLVVGGALIAALFPMAGTALAVNTITLVTGGSAISADTGPAPTGTAAWTSLGGPVVTEGAAADIPATGTVTLTLTGGFEFRTVALGGTAGAAFTASAGACDLTRTTPVVGATTITTDLGGTVTSGSDRCQLTFSGIQVRPTTGTTPNTGALTFSGAITGAAGSLAMVAGSPILTFTKQPSSPATAGTAFSPVQPEVTSQDRFTNKRESDSITLAIKNAAGTEGFSCTTNPLSTNASGVAAFAGCKINKAGTGYQLRATATGATAVDSTAISVDPGAANQIGFATQPARGIPNVSFGSQPVVAVQDAQGNTVPTAGATTVTLSLTTGSGTLTCLGTGGLSKGTILGLAAFTGCRLTAVGVGFKITATAPGYPLPGGTVAVSSSFDIADRLAFTTQPAGAVGGVAFTTQPAITVRAGASATAANDNGTVVTLAIKSGTGASGAALTCTDGLTRTAVAGVATFAGCSIDKSSPTGNPYVLVATSPNLTNAESSSLAVVAGAASKVLFTVQPAATNVNVVFAAAPAVSITDAGGNVVTTGASSTASVTLAMGSNPGAGTLACTGGLTKAAVAGVATFTGCSINSAGVGYTLVASSTGLTSATSTAFNVTAPAAVISLVRSTGMVRYSEYVGLTIQFGTGGGNRTFFLEHSSVGVAWHTIATLATNSAGAATFSYRPYVTGYYRVRFAGATDLSAANSNVVLVGVRQIVNLRPHHAGTQAIARGTSITFLSSVRPLRPDLVASTVTFRFYQSVGGAWLLRYTRTVAVDSAAVASTTFRFGAAGLWYVRAFAPRTPYASISAYTQREVFLVR